MTECPASPPPPPVDDGAILDVSFEHFRHAPPPGFDAIMIEKSLLDND